MHFTSPQSLSQRLWIALVCLAACFCCAPAALAQTWTGGGANTNFSTSGNWSLLPTSSSTLDLLFTDQAASGLNLNVDLTNGTSGIFELRSLTVQNNGATTPTNFVLSGNALYFSNVASAITLSAVSTPTAIRTLTINNNILLGNGTTLTMSSGVTTTNYRITVGGNISLSSGATSGTLELNGSSTHTNNMVTGQITGSLAVVKNGAGNWRLSGNNNFTNGVTITGGSLLLTGANQIAGGLVVNGLASSLVLSGSNALSGNILVSNGTLRMSNTNALGGVTDIMLGNAATSGSISYSNGTAYVATQNITVTGVGTSRTNGAAILSDSTVVGATLTFNGNVINGLTSGTAMLTLGGANTEVNVLASTLTNGSAGKALGLLFNGAGVGQTWDLTGANTFTGGITISNGAVRATATNASTNLNFNTVSGNNIRFAGAVGTLALLETATATFTNSLGTGPGQFLFMPTTVTQASGGWSALGGAVNITLNNDAATPISWSGNLAGNLSTSTRLQFNSANADNVVTFNNSLISSLTNRSVLVTDNPNSNADYAVMSGTLTLAGFTKVGSGYLALTGSNSLTGTTIISGGYLRGSTTANLNLSSVNTRLAALTSAGAILESSGAITNNLGSAAGEIMWANWGAVNATNSGSGGFSAFGNPLSVTLNNDNSTPLVWGTTLNFVGTGTTGVNTAELQFGSIMSNDVVTFNNPINLGDAARTIRVYDNPTSTADYAVLAGVISSTTPASGGIVKQGAGTLVLANDNTFAGVLNIAAGTVRLGNGGSTGSIASSSITNAGNLVFSYTTGTTKTLSTLIISGAGNVELSSAGATLFLGIGQTYTGTTSITAGTLRMGVASALPAASVVVLNNTGTLDLYGQALTVATLIPGAGGAGAVTSGTAGAAAITISSTTINTSFNGLISDGSGTVSLIKAGAGTTLTLGGSNSYSGGTTLTAGNIVLASASALGTGTVRITAGILDYGAGDKTFTNPFDFNGTFTITGGGNLTLTSGLNSVSAASVVTFSNPGNVTVSGINLGADLTVNTGGTLAVNGTTVVSAASVFTNNSVGGMTLNNIQLGAGLSIAATAPVVINGNISDSGSGGGLTVASGNVTFNGTGSYTGNTTITTGTVTLSTPQAFASGLLRTGAATTINLSTGGTGSYNLSMGGTPLVINGAGLSMTFDGPGTNAINITSTLNSNLDALTFVDSTVWSAAGFTRTGTAPISFLGGLDLQLAATQTMTVGATAGGVTVGNVNLNTSGLNLRTTGGLTINGTVSGASALGIRLVSGGLTLNGNNNYGGTTVLSVGSLTIGHLNALGNSSVDIIANTFYSQVSGNITNTINLGGAITFSNTGQSLSFDGPSTFNVTAAGTITNNLPSLTITDDILLGANLTLAGTVPTTVAGSIGLTGGDRTLTSSATGGEVINNVNLSADSVAHVLSLAGTSTITVSGVISGVAGSGVNVASGTVVFNNANTHSGGTTLTGGTTFFSNAGAFGTGGLTFAGGGLTGDTITALTITNAGLLAGALTINPGAGLTFTGVLTQTGAGRTITLAGGSTTFTSINLSALSGDATARSLTFAGSGAVAGSLNLTGTIADGGVAGNGVTFNITNTNLPAIMNATNSYTGGTTITAGAVRVSSYANQLGSSPLRFNAAAGTMGVVETAGSLTNNLGTAANQISWVVSGGFAARGGDLSVTLNNNAASTMTWGSANFVAGTNELQFSSPGSDGTVTFNNPVDLANALHVFRVFDGSASIDAILSAGVAGGGASGYFQKQGPGTLRLDGAGTVTGTTLISAGTLRIGNGVNATGTTGGGRIRVDAGGTVIFDRVGVDSTQAIVSGAGTFVQNQNNTIFATTFAHTGNVTVNTGTLQIGVGVAGSFSSASVGLTTDTANLAFNTNAVLSVAADISGAGNVFYNQAAAVSWTLLGAQSHTGMTYVSGFVGSQLNIGNGVNTGSGSIAGNITLSGADGTLIFNRPDDMTYAGNLTGSGTQVRKLTNSTLTVSGNSTFSSPVSIDGGTLVVSGTFGTGGGTIGSGAVLRSIGGTAGGTWTAGNSTIEIGGVTTNTVSNLTLGGLVLNAGSVINFDLQTAATDTSTFAQFRATQSGDNIIVGTAPVLNGATTINLNPLSGINNGHYILFSGYSGTIASDNLFTLNLPGFSVTQYNTDGAYYIDIFQAVVRTWNGNVNNLWDSLTTSNWQGDNYYDDTAGQSVLFNDTLTGTSNINISNGGAVHPNDVTVNTALTYTFNGDAIAGAASLSKQGSGLLVLNNNNTFTGGIAVAGGGTLQLGSNNTSGSITPTVAIALADNSTFAVNRSDALSLTNGISGTGTFRKSGSGTLSYFGTSTFFGNAVVDGGTLEVGGAGLLSENAAVTVSSGTLNINSSANQTLNSITVTNGGSFLVSNVGTVLTTTLNLLSGTLTLTGANLSVTSGGAINLGGSLNTRSVVSIESSRTITLSSNINYNAANNASTDPLGAIIGGSGVVDAAGAVSGNVSFGGAASGSRVWTIMDSANAVNDVTIAANIPAGNAITKTGGGTLYLMGLNSSGSALTFQQGTIVVGGATSAAAIAPFGTAGLLVSGNGGQILMPDSFARTLTRNIVLGGDLTIGGTSALTVASTALVINSTAGRTLTINNSNVTFSTLRLTNAAATVLTMTLAGNGGLSLTSISGFDAVNASTLVVNGNGLTVNVLGANTYAGPTTIMNGTVKVADATSLGTANSPITLGVAGGTVNPALLTSAAITFTRDLAALAGSGATITVGGATAVTSTFSGNVTFSQALNVSATTGGTVVFSGLLAEAGGAFGVTKTGDGTVVFTNNNTYSGTTTIAAGTLRIGNGGATGSIVNSAIVNSGVLIFDRSDAVTRTLGISGTGAVQVGGTAVANLTFLADNSYSGVTTITSGSTLNLGNGGSAGSAGSSPIVNNGFLIFDRSNAVTRTAGISGTGTVQIGNTVPTNVTFLADGTYNGTTTISSGSTLNLGNGGSGGSIGSSTIVNNGFLIFDRNTAVTRTAGISGTGTVRIGNTVPTNVTFLADSTYNGTTTISSGSTLNLGNGGSGGSIGSSPIVDNGFLIFDRSSAVTRTAGISGTGTVQIGNTVPTSVTLLADNTYSGETTILPGSTLSLGDGGTSGSISGASIVNNGQLIYNRSNDVSYGGVISGTGILTKQGAGTLTLGGNNTYSGATSVAAGTLLVSGTLGNSHVTVGGSGTLAGGGTIGGTVTLNGGNLSPGTSPGTLTMASLILNGGTLNFELGAIGAGTSDQIILTGGLAPTVSAATSFNFTNLSGYTTGTYVLISGYTGTIANFGSLTSVTNIVGGYAVTLLNTDNQLELLVAGLSGTNLTWVGNVNNVWNTTDLNWTNGTSLSFTDAGNVATFNNTTSTNNITVTSGGVTPQSMIVNNDSSHNYLFTGGAITGSEGLTKQGDGSLIFANDVTFTGATVTGGTLQIGNGGSTGSFTGDIINSAVVAFNRTTGSLTYANVISGSGAVSIDGGLTLVFTGANTYTGVTTILDGTLQIGGGSTTGSVASSSIVNSGLLAFDRSDTLTYGGVISGSGDLSKLGSNLLILSGNNTFTGQTTINGGTLQLKGDYASAINVNGNVLQFDTNGTLTISGIISGGGVLQKLGTGTAALTAVNTFNGITSIDNGTLLVDNALGGTVYVNNNGYFLGSGVNGSTVVIAGGSGTISGTQTGTTNVNTGTITVTDGGDLAGEVNVGGGTLNVSSSGTISGTLTQTSGIVNINTGAATSGALSVGGGTFNVNAGGSADSTPGITVGSGGTFNVNTGSIAGNGSITVSGSFVANGTVGGGSASLIVANGGSLTGTGNIQGDVTINTGGTLSPGNSVESLGMGNLSLTHGSNLVFEFRDATGLHDFGGGDMGAGFGWDLIDLGASGVLNLGDAAATNQITLDISAFKLDNSGHATSSGDLIFNPQNSYEWLFIKVNSLANLVTNGNGDDFNRRFNIVDDTLNAGVFETGNNNPFTRPTSSLGEGTFTVAWRNGAQGMGMYIQYSAIPEPGSMILAGLAAGGLGWYRRRRRVRSTPAEPNGPEC